MCEKKQFKYCPSEIDECMRPLIKFLQEIGEKTVACCCGHSRYSMTIVVESIFPENGKFFEILSETYIDRKKKIYKKDKEGYYFIPEVDDEL